MKLKKIKQLALISTFYILNIPSVFADAPPIIPDKAEDGKNMKLLLPNTSQSGSNAINNEILPTVTRTIITLSATSAVLFIIWGAVQILTAYGDPAKIDAGKKTMRWAIQGLIVAILAYSIVSVIGGLSTDIDASNIK